MEKFCGDNTPGAIILLVYNKWIIFVYLYLLVYLCNYIFTLCPN